jgi:hypothetical protein
MGNYSFVVLTTLWVAWGLSESIGVKDCSVMDAESYIKGMIVFAFVLSITWGIGYFVGKSED